MSIIVCRECREETDNRRDRCSHCGAPLAGGDLIVKEKKPFNLFLLIVITIIAAVGVGGYIFLKPYFVAPEDYDLVEITSRDYFLSAIRSRKAAIVIIYDNESNESYSYLPIAKEIGKKYNLNIYKLSTSSTFYPEGSGSNLFGIPVSDAPVTLIYKGDKFIASHEGFRGKDFIENFLEINKIIKRR